MIHKLSLKELLKDIFQVVKNCTKTIRMQEAVVCKEINKYVSRFEYALPIKSE